MKQREKLSQEAIASFQEANPGWRQAGSALMKTFTFESYGAGIAFVVRLGFLAEARQHHPELFVGYRSARVEWTTHDAGGITAIDLEMAAATEELAK